MERVLKPVEQRRLHDLREGANIPAGTTLLERAVERGLLHDAIAAGQSLDDLGEELNTEVMTRLDALLERYARLTR